MVEDLVDRKRPVLHQPQHLPYPSERSPWYCELSSRLVSDQAVRNASPERRSPRRAAPIRTIASEGMAAGRLGHVAGGVDLRPGDPLQREAAHLFVQHLDG